MQIEASFAAHIERISGISASRRTRGCQWEPAMIFTDRAGTMVNETPAYLSMRAISRRVCAQTAQLGGWMFAGTPLTARGGGAGSAKIRMV